jgi:ribosome biogenesis GTPase
MDDYFECLFDPSRKECRRERKIASKSDRSKYKTSNLQKKEKEPPPNLNTLFEGRVTSIHSHNIDVATSLGKLFCTLKGTLKEERHHHKNLIIVGDLVLLEPLGNGEGVIHHVQPRTSVLSRQDHLHRIKRQLVAANVDQVLITTSFGEPSFRPSIIDRYLVAAEKGNLHPAIVINKIDVRAAYEENAATIDECVALYKKLGYGVACVSARTGEGMDHLRSLMQGKISVFSGQSGTGKTELVNALTGMRLQTQEVRSGGKGAHTTTSAKLLDLPFGGFCIDTPGIRSFGIWDFKQEDLPLVFKEIAEAAEKCYFSDCKHQGEEGCFVIQAIEEGLISPLRYSSYLSLLSSLQENKEWYV